MAVKITKDMLAAFGEGVTLTEAQEMVNKAEQASAKMLEDFRKKHDLPQVQKK